MLPLILATFIAGTDVWNCDTIIDIFAVPIAGQCVDSWSSTKRDNWVCSDAGSECSIKILTITGSCIKYTRECESDPIATYSSVPDQLTIHYDTKEYCWVPSDWDHLLPPALVGLYEPTPDEAYPLLLQ